MRFNSAVYPLFLAAVAALLAFLPPKRRFWAILFLSYLFYATWSPFYLVLLLLVGLVAQRVGQWAAQGDPGTRARRAYSGVAVLMVILVAFRSQPVLVDVHEFWASTLGSTGGFLDAAVPLGLSFYVFEAIGYLVEVAKGREKAYSFWDFQLFMAFFPHLVAGPIMRAKELIGQFREPDALAPKDIGRGIWLLVSGLFMKVVIADQLAPKIDVWFEGPAAALRSRDVAVLALGFGLQMYFDFAGYSRIAQGSGTLCGIRLVKNFNYPFSAVSPPDFWNRWHISLSRWIRDYIFLALVGRSRTLTRLCAAAVIAMVLCGLWHGFGMKFVVWGAFHGLVIAGYQIYRYVGGARIGSAMGSRSPTVRRAHDLAGWAATTAILLPGWILFRAKTLSQAGAMLITLVTPHRHPGRTVEGNLYLHITALFAVTLAAPFVQSLIERTFASIERTNVTSLRLALDATRGVAVGVIVAASLLYLGTKASFIYFQF